MIQNTLNNGSEAADLANLLKKVPDGEESVVAQQLEYACGKKWGRNKKPHLTLYETLAGIVEHNRSLRY